MPTPPECTSETYRVLLGDIRSTVPDGLASAVFMYLAMNMIHGFGDGNGRLSRFLLGWECESAGLAAIVIPLELRSDLAKNLVAVLFEKKLEGLVEVLKKAHLATDRLLQQICSENTGSHP